MVVTETLPGFKDGDAAELCTQGWAGFRAFPVTVLGRTPKKVRVELKEEALLPGGRRKAAGDVALVPESSLRRPQC